MLAARAVVALLLVVPTILSVARPQWMAWSSLTVPEWIRWSGVVLGVLTIAGVWWVLRTLGYNLSETVLTKRDHQLITTGPYRWVRYPLYTVGIALFLSIALVQASWLVLST